MLYTKLNIQRLRLSKIIKQKILNFLKRIDLNRIKKLSILITIIYLFLIYQSRKKKVKKFFKQTNQNLEIYEALKDDILGYQPSFWLPTSFSMIFYGQRIKKEYFFIKFETQKIQLSDNGILYLDWYPPNYNDLPVGTPIVAFILGSFGTNQEPYAKEFAIKVKQKGWRFVILNRRGFDYRKLHNNKFVDKNEGQDFFEALTCIKEIYQSPIYLSGVSAGANIASKFVGVHSDSNLIDALVSISNPFNFTKVVFNLNTHLIGKLISFFLVRGWQNLYDHHLDNPHFLKNFLKKGLTKQQIEQNIRKYKEVWKFDEQFTLKTSGHDHILEYYHDISCEQNLLQIKIPSLFISNIEDPICIIQASPIDKLYLNENIMYFVTQRGGHIEYLHGKNKSWWAFDLAIKYFDFFEKKKLNQIIISYNGKKICFKKF